MHVIAAKAVCFKEALQPEFKDYAKMIVENAQALCKGLQKRGIDIVSGGTDNHLMLVDLRSLGVTGKQMENLLDEVNITCNKNAIPNDPQSPFVTSGVRLGTAAVTSRDNSASSSNDRLGYFLISEKIHQNEKDEPRHP